MPRLSSFGDKSLKRRKHLAKIRLPKPHTAAEVEVQPSTSTQTASERKLGYVGHHDSSDESDSSHEEQTEEIATVITRTSMLSALVKGLLCLVCQVDALAIRAVDRKLGLVCGFETYCTACGAVLNSTLSSERIGGSTSTTVPFVITRETVAASMDMGVGHAGIVKLCRFLNMSPIHHKSFSKHVSAVVEANKKVVADIFENAAKIVRQAYRALDSSIGPDDIIDLTVSFDGSWMTRGHKSMYGIGCVVDVVTGLVLDFAVLLLYCQRCAYACTRFGSRTATAFTEWYAGHADECNANYSGSSGGMEMKAAEILWRRSLDHGFRYTTLLSDGDAKTFKHLCDLRLYGDVQLDKEECINHVAKRLGTALRKLSSQGRKAGVTLGGRGHGKLTQATIVKLTAYYGKAVRSHSGDLAGMRNAILATFYHAVSTDDTPQHDYCPAGEDSWCFYQKAQAAGQLPGPHKTNVGTPLSAAVAEHVKDVYVRLSHDDLLRRCLRGATQNANESLHSKVWAKCPKTGFVGLQRVIGATSSAIAEFNCGIEETMTRLCASMGITSGARQLSSAEKVDSRRIMQSKRRAQASTREARRSRRIARERATAAANVDYAPGEF